MKYRILSLAVALSLCLATVGSYAYEHREQSTVEQSDRYHQHLEAADKAPCSHGDELFCTHLPLLNIDTGGKEIPGAASIDENGNEVIATGSDGETFVFADIQIFDNATQNNHLTDTATDAGTARIRVRGNSSRHFDKLGYSLTFVTEEGKNESHAVMGMDAHHEWVLHGPFLDKTLLRNYMWYNIAGDFMDYAPNVRFCEAFLNGEYVGVYVMVESITAGQTADSRLALSMDRKGHSFTGYCLRLDRGSTDFKTINTFANYTMRNRMDVDIVYPGTSNLTPELRREIELDFSYFERILFSFDYNDDKYGYESMIDVQSFVDYFILNEFTSNYDAGWLSTYVYKDVDGLFHLCVWDFNSACDNYNNAMDPHSFLLMSQPWYLMLTKSEDFVEAIIERYRDLRETYLSDAYINQYIDETVDYLGDAIARNYEKWGYTFGEEEDILKPTERNPRSYEEAIENMKSYIKTRSVWMDANIESLMQYASESKNKKFNEAK